MADSQREISSPDVPCKLLSLAEVMLAAKPLTESLTAVVDFFQWPVSVLMAYSTEGVCVCVHVRVCVCVCVCVSPHCYS